MSQLNKVHYYIMTIQEVIRVKIVKRNGQIVNYDPTKISVAIAKANAEVPASERIEEDKINEIISYIES